MFTVKKGYNRAALYFYQNGKQVAHLGIDPRADYNMLGAAVYGGVFVHKKDGKIEQHCFRSKLPHLSWKAAEGSEFLLAVYQLQNKILSAIDKVGK